MVGNERVAVLTVKTAWTTRLDKDSRMSPVDRRASGPRAATE